MAQPITLLIDRDPPLIEVDQQGHLRGELGTYVTNLLKHAGLTAKFEQWSWNRAFAKVKQEPNACLVPIARTAVREDLFKWIGPLHRVEFGLFALEKSPITARDLEEVAARGLTVGTVDNEISDNIIAAYPKVRRAPVRESLLNARKLAAGRIDLWASSEGSARGIAGELNLPPLRKVIALAPVEVTLACHPATRPEMLGALTKAYERLGPFR